MAQYLSDIVEEDSIQCSVCEKNFIVKFKTVIILRTENIK